MGFQFIGPSHNASVPETAPALSSLLMDLSVEESCVVICCWAIPGSRTAALGYLMTCHVRSGVWSIPALASGWACPCWFMWVQSARVSPA